MNTEQFFNFISSSLGKDASKCSHCKNQNSSYLCGGCMQVAFCGEACHKKAWNMEHKLECVFIQGREKREREIEDAELKDPRDTKKSKEYIDLTDRRFRNPLQVLQTFLSASDVKNVSGVSKYLNEAMRKAMFQSQTYRISRDVLNDPFFKSIAPYIQNVFIDRLNRADLITLKELAPNIRKITFGNGFNQNVSDVLPESLTHLTFGSNFDRDVRDALPQSLTHLTFGNHFDRDVSDGVLPQSLTHLTFGQNFNQDVNGGVLPQSLTHLAFGWYFCRSLRGALPQSLTHLILGFSFNGDVRHGVLPQGLTHLTFGWSFEQDLAGHLPKELEYFKITREYEHQIFNLLPMSVTTIKIAPKDSRLSDWQKEADRIGATLIYSVWQKGW